MKSNPLSYTDRLGLQIDGSGGLPQNFGVFTFTELDCSGGEGPGPREQAFIDGIDIFTTSAGQNVTTLHNMTLGRIFHRYNIDQNGVSGGIEPGLPYPNFQFSIRSDGEGCDAVFFLNCEDVDREADRFAPNTTSDIYEELALGIGSIDSFYAGASDDDLEPANWDDNSGAIVTINATATEQDIRSELESLLGGLAEESEIQAILDRVAAERGGEPVAALINVQPLYDAVLERFYDLLLSNEEVIRTYDTFQLETIKYEINGPEIRCIPGPAGCIDEAYQFVEAAGVAHERALERQRGALIAQGLFPRHDYDLEADAKRDSLIFESLLGIVTGDLALLVTGAKAAASRAVSAAAVSIGGASRAARSAAESALTRWAIARAPANQAVTTRAAFDLKFSPDSFKSPEHADAAWQVYRDTSTDPRHIVVGRLDDTRAAEARGFQRLGIPNDVWEQRVNDAWVQGGIDAGRPFYVASHPEIANYRSVAREGPGGEFLGRGGYPETVFFKEMKQLRDAGYYLDGDFMRPPDWRLMQ